MTTMKLARRAIQLFSNDWVPKSTNRHNQRHWIASIRSLGDRWLLAKPINKPGP